MTRSIQYRRAQQERMIKKAERVLRESLNFLDTYRGYNHTWADFKTGYVKSWANNLRKCSCSLCSSKWDESDIPRVTLRSDVSTRQQIEELNNEYASSTTGGDGSC